MDAALLSNSSVMMNQAGQTDISATMRSLQEQTARSQDAEDAKRIAKDFEAVFITEMMKPMFEGVDIANSAFGGGKGEEVFNKLLLQEYGKAISERGELGIAEEVEKMILKVQEAQQNTHASPTPQTQRDIGDVINAYTQHSTTNE